MGAIARSLSLRWHVCRVNFAWKIFFRATNFLTKNAPKFSPKFLSLCSVGQKKSPENSLQISHHKNMHNRGAPKTAVLTTTHPVPHLTPSYLGGRFGYFLFFLLGGEGKGVPEAPGGGALIFYWKSQEGGLQEGEGPRDREGVCGKLGNLGGGG